MNYTTTVTTIAALAFTATAVKRFIYPEPDLKYDSESDLDSDSDLDLKYTSSGQLSDKILEDLDWFDQNHPNWREPPKVSIKFN
jgi:hypothetical protein